MDTTPPPFPPTSESSASPPASPGADAPKSTPGQILEEGFKDDLKSVKTGCLAFYHIGCLVIILIVIVISLGGIWQAIIE